MKTILNDIEPKLLWFWFERISKIPRPSGHEKQIADMLVQFAEERGFDYRRDTADNVLITVGGKGASADGQTLMLQAHVDIVPEKLSSSEHDFLTDPIDLEIKDGWVTATETTLGADNGIGVAIMLAVLDSDEINHPPLECLFTTDEERGLTGAAELDPNWFSARRMINLDSEEENAITIGCAGGVDFIVSDILIKSENPSPVYKVNVTGLKGGHSGMEIIRNRANAVKVLARILFELGNAVEIGIVSIESGKKRNAIPRDACAVITAETDLEYLQGVIEKTQVELLCEYEGIEDRMEISIESTGTTALPYIPECSQKIVDLLLALPHGVMKMSGVVDGLVETSLNLAIVSTENDKLVIFFAARSSLESAKYAICNRVGAIAELAGCKFEVGDAYPGWMPDVTSGVLGITRKVCKDVFGTEPKVEAIHAGLECGLIGGRIEGMEMISIGPDIRDVHVPGERVDISSVNRFWEFFLELLPKLG